MRLQSGMTSDVPNAILSNISNQIKKEKLHDANAVA
jgi:hypothetical protein